MGNININMNTNSLSPRNNQYTFLDNNFSNFSTQVPASTQNTPLYSNMNVSNNTTFGFNDSFVNNSNSFGYNNANNTNMNMLNMNLDPNKKQSNNSFDLI